MSIKISELDQFMVQISKRFEVDLEELRKLSLEEFQINPYFNKNAEEFAKEHNIDPSKVEHSSKSGKITITCLKKYLGIQVKKSDAFTAAARKLARQKELTEDSFPEESRSGKIRKTTGIKEITIQDVRMFLGISDSPSKFKMSPKAKDMLEKMEIDVSKIQGTGKDGRIKVCDIENFLQSTESDDSDEETSSVASNE